MEQDFTVSAAYALSDSIMLARMDKQKTEFLVLNSFIVSYTDINNAEIIGSHGQRMLLN